MNTRDWGAITAGDEIDPGLTVRSPQKLVDRLEEDLRASFPINGVPHDLIDLLQHVKRDAKSLTHSVHEFVRAMEKHFPPAEKIAPLIHAGFGPRDVIRGSMCGGDGMITKDASKVNCEACISVIRDTSHRG